MAAVLFPSGNHSPALQLYCTDWISRSMMLPEG